MKGHCGNMLIYRLHNTNDDTPPPPPTYTINMPFSITEVVCVDCTHTVLYMHRWEVLGFTVSKHLVTVNLDCARTQIYV